MLRYGEPQVAIGIVFLLLALLIGAVFVTVALQTVSDVPFERVQGVGYWLRKRWLAFLCALLVLVVGLSLFNLPYARGGGARRSLVQVTGVQFAWVMTRTRLPLNRPIRFEITARDVNHGFAIYDPHGHMIGSVQAMPGYTNKLDLTFHTPGLYTIRCFELCGLDHHLMQASFIVR
jgi:cytochrome c oxidase subunit 2